MPRIGVPANFHGKKGVSGRKQDGEYRRLVLSVRKKLMKAVEDEISGKKVKRTTEQEIAHQKACEWARIFANRLIPNPMEVSGEGGGALVVKLVQFTGD